MFIRFVVNIKRVLSTHIPQIAFEKRWKLYFYLDSNAILTNIFMNETGRKKYDVQGLYAI